MNKFYLLSSLTFILISCSTRISYMGESAEPTNKVDFFVDPSSISKNYKVMGKGYLQFAGKAEKIQEQAILKGMEIGADAVVVQDYWTSDSGTIINTSIGIDSTRKKVINTRDSNGTGFSIIYLKYL